MQVRQMDSMNLSTPVNNGRHIREYYRQISAGEIIVSDKVRRVYKELVRALDDDSGEWTFDETKAEHPIAFIEKYCKHSKGKLLGSLRFRSQNRRNSPLS